MGKRRTFSNLEQYNNLTRDTTLGRNTLKPSENLSLVKKTVNAL